MVRSTINFRMQLAWLVSQMLVDTTIHGCNKRTIEPPKDANCKSSSVITSLTRCTDHPNPFQLICNIENVKECSVFACANGEEYYNFRCGELGITPPGENSFSCGDDSSFLCPSTEFECADRNAFTCNDTTSDFTCDAEVFSCTPKIPNGFQCNVGELDFDCSNTPRLFDFKCNPGNQGIGYDCEPNDGEFTCQVNHIFKCYQMFACITSHKCTCPKGACNEIDRWEPSADNDDDGIPGDFDCDCFACAGSEPQHPAQNFDCGAPLPEPSSQFKCLDTTGLFSCGENSIFECGQEHEGYVCHNYTCPANFRCTEAFICGDITGHMTFTCPGTTPETKFMCLAGAAPADWLTFDCGGGTAQEHRFKCHTLISGEYTFICPAFDCPLQTWHPPDE